MNNSGIVLLVRSEKIRYLFWGILTTVFYFLSRICLDFIFHIPIISATLSEIVTILFAFFVNQKYVFTKSKKNSLTYQLVTFFIGRIIVALIDIFVTYITIEKYFSFSISLLRLDKFAYNSFPFNIPFLRDIIGSPYALNNIIWIVVIQISAIIINYLISKYWSFK